MWSATLETTGLFINSVSVDPTTSHHQQQLTTRFGRRVVGTGRVDSNRSSGEEASRFFSLDNLLEAARDEVDKDWIAVLQYGRQIFRARLPLSTLTVGDAARVALGI